MILPLAHHNLVISLPVFGPAVVVCVVVAIHHFRERRRWDDEETEDSPRP
ncbi:MAG: hypothetical protein ACTHO8_04990 [Solirubrobacterales bacterium]